MSQKAFAIGGVGSQPTLDDIVRIAQGIHVALDPAGAERVKKTSPPPKSFQAEACDAAPVTSGAKLTYEQCRAVVATKLMQLMNGRSGSRVQIAEFFVALLNNGVMPALYGQEDDASTLQNLALACHGLGNGTKATSCDQSLSARIAQLGVEAPKLSPAERVAMEGGAAATAGIATLTVQGSKTLLSLASAAAALSIEAVGAQVRKSACMAPCSRHAFMQPMSCFVALRAEGELCPAAAIAAGIHTGTGTRTHTFQPLRAQEGSRNPQSNLHVQCGLQVKALDADNMEAQGYKAAASAADELRGMLEGSKRAGTLKAAENDALPSAFSTVAQRLGAASEAVAAAYTAVRSEVQAEALAPKVAEGTAQHAQHVTHGTHNRLKNTEHRAQHTAHSIAFKGHSWGDWCHSLGPGSHAACLRQRLQHKVHLHLTTGAHADSCLAAVQLIPTPTS